MQMDIKRDFYLPDSVDEAVRYDAFFQNKDIIRFLGLKDEECCIDMYGYRTHNLPSKRYLLSIIPLPYKVLKSYGLSFHPIEVNIFNNNHGNDIYLYDTSIPRHIDKKKNGNYITYYFRFISMIRIVNAYGIGRIIKDTIKKYLK